MDTTKISMLMLLKIEEGKSNIDNGEEFKDGWEDLQAADGTYFLC